MSACKGCGGRNRVCTCVFDSNEEVTQSGNGRVYSPVNFRPNNVPLPRPYGYQTRQSSDQFIPASSTTAIVFDSAAETPFAGGMISDPVDSRLTVPLNGAGVFLVYGFANFTRPDVVLSIRKNGTERLASQTSPEVTADFGSSVRAVMTTARLVPSDYLELIAINTGALASTFYLDFSMFFVTPPLFWAQWMRD